MDVDKQMRDKIHLYTACELQTIAIEKKNTGERKIIEDEGELGQPLQLTNFDKT